MENKNNENKQQTNLVFIKKLAEDSAGSNISDLLREVKKARQQLDPLIKQMRDKITDIKQEKERQEALNAIREKQEQLAKADAMRKEAPKISMEELVKSHEEKMTESNIDVDSKPKEVVEPKKEEVKEVVNTSSVKPATEAPRTYTNNNNARQPYNNQRTPYDPNRPRPAYDPNRPRPAYDPNRPRPAFDPNRPRPAYDPNRPRPAFDPNRPRPPFDPNRPRPAFDPNRPRPAYNNANNKNNSLLSITKVKKDDLTSASVFVNKERNFGNKKKSSDKSADDKKLNKKQLVRRGIVEEQSIEERMVSRKLKLKKPKQEVQAVVHTPITHVVITTPNLTVKILSEKIGKPATEIIKQFMVLGIMTTINSTIDFATAELVASELGITLELNVEKTFEEKLEDKKTRVDSDDKSMTKRPPVVTVMGHVDHGKTSLLDKLRKTNVTAGEAGGITQHIGAYTVNVKGESITFIDTPGHAAFTAMRARGAQITDIAILVVAADDGIMPQTIEAINHIKAAKVPMIVAINKIDKPTANIDRIKQQLTEHDVLPEEWGGDAIIVPISALTGEGIDKLLEMILLVADMQGLKANKDRPAYGVVVEAKLDKGKGPMATIIVQDGTLKNGDTVVSGFAFGRIRGMIDDKGKPISKAGPSTPVSILGLDNVPNAGDSIQVVDDKLSKNVIEERKARMAQEMAEKGIATSLDDFLNTKAGEEKKVLSLIVKADVQGSVEALRQSLSKVENEEVRVDIIHSGVGAITETDIQLAKVSKAIIIGFNTKTDSKATVLASKEKVDIKYYKVIYEALDEIERITKGMKEPKYEEKIIGHAEVRMLFKISSVGTIAGCRVLDGKVQRNCIAKVMRGKDIVFEGKVVSLKNQKDDAKEMAAGFECGIKLDGYNDLLEGDIIECSMKERIEE